MAEGKDCALVSHTWVWCPVLFLIVLPYFLTYSQVNSFSFIIYKLAMITPSFRESLWRLKIVYRKYIKNCRYSKMVTTFLRFLLIWVQNSANSSFLVKLQNWAKEINSASQNLLLAESDFKAIVFWTQKKCYDCPELHCSIW